MLFSKTWLFFQYSKISFPVFDKSSCLYSLYISALTPKFKDAKLRILCLKTQLFQIIKCENLSYLKKPDKAKTYFMYIYIGINTYMRNKYMRRGIWLILFGIGLNLLGYYLMEEDVFKYGWAMITGTLAFGIGFLSILYSLMRKMDRKSILEERAAEAEDDTTTTNH